MTLLELIFKIVMAIIAAGLATAIWATAGLFILAVLRNLAEWYMDFKYWVERKFKGGE